MGARAAGFAPLSYTTAGDTTQGAVGPVSERGEISREAGMSRSGLATHAQYLRFDSAASSLLALEKRGYWS